MAKPKAHADSNLLAGEFWYAIGPDFRVRARRKDSTIWLAAGDVEAYHQQVPRRSPHRPTPGTGRWTERWNEFQQVMASRLQEGYHEYGDGSFSREPTELLNEIREELLDLIGWPYITWCRVSDMIEALEKTNDD